MTDKKKRQRVKEFKIEFESSRVQDIGSWKSWREMERDGETNHKEKAGTIAGEQHTVIGIDVI
jgi:hypothetical protein